MMKNDKKQTRAGVIPYFFTDDGDIEMMFMVPSDSKYGGAAWQIAKGKIDKGETPEEAAFREAEEELGLFKPNIKQSRYLGKFGSIEVYIAEIDNKDLFGEPHFETGDTKWLTPKEFQEQGRDWQRPIVKAAVRLIKKNHNE